MNRRGPHGEWDGRAEDENGYGMQHAGVLLRVPKDVLGRGIRAGA